MLTVPSNVRLWFAGGVDLRLGFDGLAARVQSQLDADPLSGHLFVFTNRNANRLKVLYWATTGFCLWCQRLEAGRYHFPAPGPRGIELTPAQFHTILEGIDLTHARRFRRFTHPAPTT